MPGGRSANRGDDGLTRGVVTLCIGGGQGIALAIEAMR
jgi:acetyl-CoA acetyltransferase